MEWVGSSHLDSSAYSRFFRDICNTTVDRSRNISKGILKLQDKERLRLEFIETAFSTTIQKA